MINIAPGDMIAARHEIKLVTEVAVPVVEIAVEDQLGHRNDQYRAHTIGEEWTFSVTRDGDRGDPVGRKESTAGHARIKG